MDTTLYFFKGLFLETTEPIYVTFSDFRSCSTMDNPCCTTAFLCAQSLQIPLTMDSLSPAGCSQGQRKGNTSWGRDEKLRDSSSSSKRPMEGVAPGLGARGLKINLLGHIQMSRAMWFETPQTSLWSHKQQMVHANPCAVLLIWKSQ